jgi:hypothetical protein
MCWPQTGQAYLNSLMICRNISYFKAGGNGHFHDFGGSAWQRHLPIVPKDFGIANTPGLR